MAKDRTRGTAEPPEGESKDWSIERAETVAKLREICAEHGDNDWDDDLYLPDVLEKHLWNHLPEEG